MSCPNKSTPEWRKLAMSLGTDIAYRVFKANGERLPSMSTVDEVISKYVNANANTNGSVTSTILQVDTNKDIYFKYNLINKDGSRKVFKDAEEATMLINHLNSSPEYTFVINDIESGYTIDVAVETLSDISMSGSTLSKKALGVVKEETVVNKEVIDKLPQDIRLPILKLQEQKLLIQQTMNRKGADVLKSEEAIDKIDEEIITIIEDKSTRDVVTIMANRIESLDSDLDNKSSFSATDLRLIYSELSIWKSLIDDWQKRNVEDEIRDVGTNESEALNDPKVRNDIIEITGLLNSITARVNKQAEHTFMEASNIVMPGNMRLTIGDIRRSIEIDKFSRQARDLSTVEDKVAQAIDMFLKGQDRAAMNETAARLEKINDRVEQLPKKFDVSSPEFQNMFIQVDEDGNPTGNMVSKFSDRFFRTVDRHKYKVNRVKFLKGTKEKEIAKLKKAERAMFYNLNIADIVSEDDTVAAKALKDLSDMYGADLAESTAEKAILLHDSYLEQKELYKESVIQEVESLEDYANMTEEEIDTYVTSKTDFWNKINSPVEHGNLVNSAGNVMPTGRFIPRLPKIDNKEHFDEKYAAIENDETLSEFMRWYMDQLHYYRSKLPQNIIDQMSDNFLPEVHRELSERLMTGGLSGKNLISKLSEMFKSGEFAEIALKSLTVENRETTNAMFDSAGKRKRSIQVKHTTNSIENLLREKRSFESRLKALKANEAEYVKNDLLEVEDEGISWASKLSTTRAEIAKLRQRESLIDEELADVYRNKSTDLIGILKAFSLMATYYEHKAAVEDTVLLGERLMENVSSVKDRQGNIIESSEGAKELIGATKYTIGASLYEEQRTDRKPTNIVIHEKKTSRKKARQIKKEIEQADKDFSSGEITESVYNIRINKLEAEYESLGGNRLSWSRALDKVLGYTQIKGLGYNIPSATVNLMFGMIANQMHAASGKDFTNEEFTWAFKKMWGSALKQGTGVVKGEAEKIDNLINKYNVLFEVNETAYGTKNSFSDKLNKLGLLLPFELQKRGEYLIQGTMMAAMMKFHKIEVNGEEISLYDAYDKDGNWDAAKYGEEPTDWNSKVTGLESNEYVKFRNRMLQVIKRTHGNYDPTSYLEGKSTSIGRMLFQYKSWLPEGIGTRFERERDDAQLGRKVKGRYRTFASAGFLPSLNYLFNPKFFRLKNVKLNKQGALRTELDVQNMRHNMMEVRWMLIVVGFNLGLALAYSMTADDEEDVYALKVALNMVNRLEGDLSFYMNPMTPIDIAGNPFPILKTFKDSYNAAGASAKILYKDSDYYDAYYLFRNYGKTLPLVGNIYQLFDYSVRKPDSLVLDLTENIVN